MFDDAIFNFDAPAARLVLNLDTSKTTADSDLMRQTPRGNKVQAQMQQT